MICKFMNTSGYYMYQDTNMNKNMNAKQALHSISIQLFLIIREFRSFLVQLDNKLLFLSIVYCLVIIRHG